MNKCPVEFCVKSDIANTVPNSSNKNMRVATGFMYDVCVLGFVFSY